MHWPLVQLKPGWAPLKLQNLGPQMSVLSSLPSLQSGLPPSHFQEALMHWPFEHVKPG